jgi:N-acetyl-anhydromuramyl-L-alanine amidase AmpD
MTYTTINKPLPKGAKNQLPSRIVLHAMGEYVKLDSGNKHAYDFLKDIGLSAHALICPDGTIIRCRDDNQGAYHARGFNTDSLGVEFLVTGKHTYSSFKSAIKKPYLTFEQHISGVELLRDWCSKHTIVSIDRHSDIDPERKVDPGEGFPFDLILKDIENGRYCK